jgi:hypothetical protein
MMKAAAEKYLGAKERKPAGGTAPAAVASGSAAKKPSGDATPPSAFTPTLRFGTMAAGGGMVVERTLGRPPRSVGAIHPDRILPPSEIGALRKKHK